ncbi:MAG: CAP domain-containing protein [Nocardioides sp.]
MRSLASAIAFAMSLGLTVTLALVPAEARSPQATYQNQVFSATNQQRVKHDRPKFRKQKCVQRFAVKQARKMARQERMFHQDLSPILRRCGLDRVGENVAYGFRSGPSAVTAWMHSTGHRRNILNRGFRLLGVGARKSDDGIWYAAQVFGRKA